MKKIIIYFGLIGLLLGALVSCVSSPRPPLTQKKEAFRAVDINSLSFSDDLGADSLLSSLKANIASLDRRKNYQLQFGDLTISGQDYSEGLKRLMAVIEKNPANYISFLQENFSLFEVYGRKDWGDVFLTSYFAPEIEGAMSETERFSQPLYGLPKDMVHLPLKNFHKELGSAFERKIFKSIRKAKEHQSSLKLGTLKGRLFQTEAGRKELRPYYSRQQIDELKEPLEAEVLAWVDPIEAFFMQIQGSGSVNFGDGKKVMFGYAGQNGWPYHAIGRDLFHIIPKEKMSLQKIEEHLRSLPKQEAQQVMNKNPSYIFFHELENQPVTSFGVETQDGRTIATDARFFPKGALAFLMFQKPIFKSTGDAEPVRWAPTSRFVFDHDTGGAIKGGGRLDLFWGRGAIAKQHAGVIKGEGRLYYLVPKKVLGPMP